MNSAHRHVLAAGFASAALACALTLDGYSANSGAQRIAELEAQVQNLQNRLDQRSSAADAGNNTGAAQNDSQSQGGSNAETATAPQADASVTASYAEIADFESRAATLETEFGGVTAASDMNANYRMYLEMKHKADALSNKMDLYDEQQERAAGQGEIPYIDYVQIETAINQLDDRLDFAEDSMQFALGIYD